MQTNQQVATQQPTSFELELQSYEPQFAAALPSHIPVEKFRRTVITALNARPDLVRADRRSLFTACVRAAQDGLFPDGREAALIIFNTKNQKTGEWRKLVQYLPMVGGIIKRMRNSGELAAISAYVVFSNDAFDYELGDEPHINHKPAMGDRGQPIGVYAVAKLINGEVLREVMSVSDVEKVRAVSRSRDKGPWVDWWEEMARKTVIRRLSKRLPGSADLEEMLRREDEQYQPQPNGASIPAARPTRAMFSPHVTDIPADDEPEHDADTGEIFSDLPLLSLTEQGDQVCEQGMDALQSWWKSLTSAQRGELGAKGRAAGPHLEGWKVRALAADERGGPAPDDDPGDNDNPPGAQQQGRVENWSGGPALAEGIPELHERGDGTLDWTRWAREMVEAIHDADDDHLAAVTKQKTLYQVQCPPLVMLDIDRAYEARIDQASQQ